METTTETISCMDQVEQEMSKNIDKNRNALEILIGNVNFEVTKINSLKKLVADEEGRLKDRIKFLRGHYERQTKKIVEVQKNNQCFPNYLRAIREIEQEYSSLSKSEFTRFQKNIAEFILLLEI